MYILRGSIGQYLKKKINLTHFLKILMEWSAYQIGVGVKALKNLP